MRPCPSALAMARVPAKKWRTREDILARVESVRQSIDRSPRKATLRELAGEAAMSPHHFHRLFVSITGLTPNAYVREKRLQLAKELLGQGISSVSEACLAVGFESAATFSTAYSRRFGERPSHTLHRARFAGFRKIRKA